MSPAIRLSPGGSTIEASAGETLLDALARAGVAVEATCGGRGRCARCRVIAKGPMGPVTDDERRLFSEHELMNGWRLLCQATAGEGPHQEVEIPLLLHEAEVSFGDSLHTLHIDPPVRLARVSPPPPTIDDNRSDLSRVLDSLHEGFSLDARCDDPHVVGSLTSTLHSSEWRADVFIRGARIIGARPPSDDRPLGIAVDIGTSKLALYLMDIECGQVLETQAIPNPQSSFGEDVITRVQRVRDSAEDALAMRHVLLDTLNAAISEMTSRRSLSPTDVCESVVVCNTVMHHIFLGLPAGQLGSSPFAPATSLAIDSHVADIGLEVMPSSCGYMPPLIAGFVGSDHLAALAATGLEREERPSLLIDIGTNTEVSLAANGVVTCCSCASGPAFEGGCLEFGMRAGEGAIDSVSAGNAGAVTVSAIGGSQLRGICGSGVLDAIVEMLRRGALDEGGRIIEGAPGVVSFKDERVFRLAETSDGWITISQADVREIQKAKGAIRAGIEMLLDAACISYEELSKVILAGSFGTCIDPVSATSVALLPPVDPGIIVQAGNVAGLGACMLLCSNEERRKSESLARRVRHLELARQPDFSTFFVASTCLSEKALSEMLAKFKGQGVTRSGN